MSLSKMLSSVNGIDNEYNIDKIINTIKEENIYFGVKEELVLTLCSIKRQENTYLNKIIDIILSTTLDKELKIILIENLPIIIKEKLPKFILINFMKEQNTNSISGRRMAENIAKLTYKDSSILFNIDIKVFFSEIFMEYSSIKCFFQLYDMNNITLDMLVKNSLYQKLPLYLKNNKICTIYENQEIRTQREINLKDIKRVERELELDFSSFPLRPRQCQ